MPCLNEADTLGTCIRRAQDAATRAGIDAEVIVADNGSTDGSAQLGKELGARVVPVPEKGYGSALMGGIEAAHGRFVIMGDADDSYDFGEVAKFTLKLREGYDLVQGCRLPAGGGRILPGAMPFLHRWVGNPLLTWMVRRMFRAPIHDVYCGMRGFTASLYDALDLRCQGMEFATEMIIKAALSKRRIAEVPITLHPDGRKSHAPHLKTFRDGWRTVRFFLMSSPRWMFVVPGAALILGGLLGYLAVYLRMQPLGLQVDVHSLLVASLALLLGYQGVLFGVFSKTFSITEGLLPPDPRMERLFAVVNLEKGLVVGLLAFLAGMGLLAYITNEWRLSSYGPLDYSATMRWVIPGVTLSGLGFQTVMSSFFISILGMARK